MHIFAAANEVALLALRSNMPISFVKIELLVYLMHERCITHSNRTLVDEQFQSTKKGPRNPSLLAAYSQSDKNKIFLSWCDDACIERNPDTDKFAFETLTQEQQKAIDYVWREHCQSSEDSLMKIVTQQNTVWYKKYQPGRNRTITTEDIRSGA